MIHLSCGELTFSNPADEKRRKERKRERERERERELSLEFYLFSSEYSFKE